MTPLRIFLGYDEREAAGYHACVESILKHTKAPVSITALTGDQRRGTNAFNGSRFRVPDLCDFRGLGLWLDGSDMLVRVDIADLFAHANGKALYVVKHDYTPQSSRKYVGTPMEADNLPYPRKNWSSVILWDCGHALNRHLTPQYLEASTDQHLHRFQWLDDESIGELPIAWNWLDEYGDNAKAKLLHFTQGIPGFEHYRDSPHADEWRAAAVAAMRGLQYEIK